MSYHSHNHGWVHVTKEALPAAQKGSKSAAVALIVIGFFSAPMLIGIPIMIYGFCKLFD